MITFRTTWAMPSRWTFSIPPIRDFVARHLSCATVIVDPFAGKSTFATHSNDIAAGGVHASEFLADLATRGVVADAVLFDPPYSPRQVSECYKEAGLKCSAQDTQNGRLYKQVRDGFNKITRSESLALCFGWNSTGMGAGWETLEVMLVRHGGAHNDTICVAQRKIGASS